MKPIHPPFRMRHHAHNLTGGVAYSSDIVQRTVGIVFFGHASFRIAIPEYYSSLIFQYFQGAWGHEIITHFMRNGHGQHLSPFAQVGSESICFFHPDINFLADEFQAVIHSQSPRQHSSFSEHLKSVANPYHILSTFSKIPHRFHNRGKTGDSPCSEIIPIRKTSGEDNSIDSL